MEIKISHFKGKKHSEATRQKMRDAHVGRIITPEWRLHMSEAAIARKARNGYINSPETRRKLSIALTGKPKPEGYREKVSGANSSFWRGGKAGINDLIRECARYRKWRLDIFSRDGFICQDCGEWGGVLNADHIKPLWVIIEENKITSVEIALKCDELWDLKNGRTLCKKCHQKTDTYGIRAFSYRTRALR